MVGRHRRRVLAAGVVAAAFVSGAQAASGRSDEGLLRQGEFERVYVLGHATTYNDPRSWLASKTVNAGAGSITRLRNHGFVRAKTEQLRAWHGVGDVLPFRRGWRGNSSILEFRTVAGAAAEARAVVADARAASWEESLERFSTFPVPIPGARGYAFARHDGGDLYIVFTAGTVVYIEGFGWHPGAHSLTVGRPIRERLVAAARTLFNRVHRQA